MRAFLVERTKVSSAVTASKRRTRRRLEATVTKPVSDTSTAPKAAATAKTAAPKKPRKPRGKSTRNSAPRPVPVRLAEDDVVRARASAPHWERTTRFSVSDFFVHAKFGVGYVTGFTEQNFIVCLFEDGDTRKLIHAQT